MYGVTQDLRHAARMLRKSPGFAIIAIATLAIGIGANAAIFSVVDAVLLRPLAYRDPGRLVWVRETQPQLDDAPATAADFLDWAATSRSVELAASEYRGWVLTGRGAPQRVAGARVTPNLFSLLGTRPLLGRTLVSSDAAGGASSRFVVGESFWRSHLGSPPVGTVVRLNGQPYELVGVMPKDFDHPQQTDIWTLLNMTPEQRADRDSHYLQVIGRLAPGATLEGANAELETLTARLRKDFPKSNAGHGARMVPLRDELVGSLRRTVLVLLTAVSMVLLLACVNLGNLILAKNAARSREIAIRAAIGAGRSRLVRQLLTESALLSLLGGAAGIAVAAWGVELLSRARPFSFSDASPIRIDARILLFTLGASVATTLLFGLTPAFAMARGSLNEALGSAGRTTGGLRRSRGRTALAIGEIAVALALLIGAGLMIRSASRLAGTDPGFQSANVLLTADLVLPDTRYREDDALRAFARASVSSVAGVPGVSGVALTNSPPLAGRNTSGDFKIEGRPDWAPGKEPLAQYRVVTPGYLRLLSIPVRRGRGITDADQENSLPVALVNDALATRFFPGANPIGERLQIEWGKDQAWRTIVGVVSNVRGERLEDAPMPEIYFPFAQHPIENPIILLATAQPPERMLAPVRSAVWSIDRDLPLRALVPMSQIIADSYARRRFSAMLLTVFGFAALLIATLGVYGVLSQLVSERRKEIGIRLTLGAQRSDVFRLIAGRGVLLTCAGIGIGIVAALFLTRALGALLYEVSPTDPLTFAALALLMGVVSLLASSIPAHRATRVDPIVALRAD